MRRVGVAILTLSAGILVAAAAVYMGTFHGGPDDSVTYLAAAERLNAGHPLYVLGPGDRTIPTELAGVGTSAPLLSPPLVAVAWRPLAVIGEPVAIVAWWLVMAVAVAVAIGLLVRGSPLVGGAALALAVPSLVFQVVGGNVNALVLVGSVAAWSLWVTGRSSAAGAAVGVLVVLKIVPLPIAVWCIGVAGRGGLRGLAVGGALAGLVSLAGAGIPNHVAYLDVVAGVASAGATDFSIAGWGRDYLGLPVEVARWLPFVALAAGLIAIVAVRRRPAVGFSLAVATMTLGFGAVHFHTYALLVAAAAPLAIPRATPVAEPAARTAGIARPRPARTTPALERTVSGPS